MTLGHEHRGEERTRHERVPQLLEHHGQLGDGETLAAVAFGQVEPEPPLGAQLLPHGRQVRRRRLGHGPGHARGAVRLGPPPHGETQGLVVLGDGDRH